MALANAGILHSSVPGDISAWTNVKYQHRLGTKRSGTIKGFSIPRTENFPEESFILKSFVTVGTYKPLFFSLLSFSAANVYSFFLKFCFRYHHRFAFSTWQLRSFRIARKNNKLRHRIEALTPWCRMPSSKKYP